MKYAVEQKIFDSGFISTRIIECLDHEESFSEERKGCDYYFDVFDTVEEAQEFLQECKNA